MKNKNLYGLSLLLLLFIPIMLLCRPIFNGSSQSVAILVYAVLVLLFLAGHIIFIKKIRQQKASLSKWVLSALILLNFIASAYWAITVLSFNLFPN